MSFIVLKHQAPDDGSMPDEPSPFEFVYAIIDDAIADIVADIRSDMETYTDDEFDSTMLKWVTGTRALCEETESAYTIHEVKAK